MMTEEQRERAEKHHGLIFGFMKQYNLDWDWYGILAEALCKSAVVWEDRGGAAFSTFAYTNMRNYMLNTFRDEKLKKCIPKENLLYGDSQVYDTEETWFGKIPSPVDIESETITYVVVSDYISQLKDREKKMFKLMLDGYSQETIGQKVGLCQSQTSRKLKSMRKEIAKQLCL